MLALSGPHRTHQHEIELLTASGLADEELTAHGSELWAQL
jgi:hypothetical protein